MDEGGGEPVGEDGGSSGPTARAASALLVVEHAPRQLGSHRNFS